jgi:hypothetical protein
MWSRSTKAVKGLALPAQAIGDGAGEPDDAVHEAHLQAPEPVFLQVLGTAPPRVGAGEVYRPQVVVAQEGNRHHVIEAAPQEADDTARGRVNHLPPWPRHPHEGHHPRAAHQPQQALAQELAPDLGLVDRELLVDRGRVEQALHRLVKAGHPLDVEAQQVSHRAGAFPVDPPSSINPP